jgi:uncharacterized protein RhaS with RHS repeats
VTGLYYDHARYYDAAIGRFTSQDPKGFAAGDTNLYRYVGNEPTADVDPSGLDELPTNPFAPASPVGVTVIYKTEPWTRPGRQYVYPVVLVTPGDNPTTVTTTVQQGGAPPQPVGEGPSKQPPDKNKLIWNGQGQLLLTRFPVTITTTVTQVQGPVVGGVPIIITTTGTKTTQ